MGERPRIALRPDEPGDHPMSHDTRLDDIVVEGVEMFRAEAMGGDEWWVSCYLTNGERICWAVTARCRPRRIDWTTTEYPGGTVDYEHDQEVER